MGLLADLGLSEGEDRILLVDPPSSVLGEASGVKPRPSVVPALHTAHPARRIAWWPTADDLQPAPLSRLRWMASVAQGAVWVVLDDFDPAAQAAARARLEAAGFRIRETRDLGANSVALLLAP